MPKLQNKSSDEELILKQHIALENKYHELYSDRKRMQELAIEGAGFKFNWDDVAECFSIWVDGEDPRLFRPYISKTDAIDLALIYGMSVNIHVDHEAASHTPECVIAWINSDHQQVAPVKAKFADCENSPEKAMCAAIVACAAEYVGQMQGYFWVGDVR